MQCQGGMGGMTWPDGRPLLDQPIKLIRAFGIIYEASEIYRKKNDNG